ncbi:MAG: hypothetical protein QW735_03300 [archaeon]
MEAKKVIIEQIIAKVNEKKKPSIVITENIKELLFKIQEAEEALNNYIKNLKDLLDESDLVENSKLENLKELLYNKSIETIAKVYAVVTSGNFSNVDELIGLISETEEEKCEGPVKETSVETIEVTDSEKTEIKQLEENEQEEASKKTQEEQNVEDQYKQTEKENSSIIREILIKQLKDKLKAIIANKPKEETVKLMAFIKNICEEENVDVEKFSLDLLSLNSLKRLNDFIDRDKKLSL